VAVEYIAHIEEDDYEAFRGILGAWLPGEYQMWLRVRDRGRLRLLTDGIAVEEITVFPDEFIAFCNKSKRSDLGIYWLDSFAREKAHHVTE
jgi:hypothetical protein